MEREKIRIEDGEFTCPCGNVSYSDGFYPCDEVGKEVEPDAGGDWDEIRIVCRRCGRIIDQDSCMVLGRRGDATTSEEPASRYRVIVTTQRYITVEAANPEQAQERAEAMGPERWIESDETIEVINLTPFKDAGSQ
jgi:hypothetical protein